MNSNPSSSALTLEEIGVVSPALKRYTASAIGEDLWKRPDLSARDRAIVTVAALVARNQTIGMLHYFSLALDNGVKPGEVSEIIAHLAFYTGWSNALAAVAIAKDIFERRGIRSDQLPPASPALLPLDEAAEVQRAAKRSGEFATWLQVSCSTPRICFSVNCGCVLPWRLGTEASSR